MSQPERPALLVWADHCTCGKVHIDVYDGDGAPLTGQRGIVRALRAAARAIKSGKAQRLEDSHERAY